jgi:glyoxylase-like metal-dependent hydrolase (beta-lactamase superfamily II)
LFIGDIKIEGVRDGTTTLPPDHFGLEGTRSHESILGADGLIHLPIAGFVVGTGGKLVLMDAGLGPTTVEWMPDDGKPVKLEGGDLPRSLAAIGVRPEDIDIVLLSHLHGDHSGWIWQNDAPFFPNATVRFGKGDWETYVEQGVPGANGEGFRLLAGLGKVDLIESDGEVAPGISSLHTPGHTPGHQTYIVSSGNERALFLGDALACPVQMELPEFEALADMDKAVGIATREKILKEISGGDYVSGPHFPEVRFGRMIVGEGKPYWN